MTPPPAPDEVDIATPPSLCERAVADALVLEESGRAEAAEARLVEAMLAVRSLEDWFRCEEGDRADASDRVLGLARRLGERSRAAELLAASIAELEARGEDRGEELALRTLQLAMLLTELERWQEAPPAIEQTLAAFDDIGAEIPTMLRSVLYLGLGKANQELGDMEAAIAGFEAARDAELAAHPGIRRSHPGGLVLYLAEMPLAELLEDGGRLEEAEAVYRSWLDETEASLRPDHPALSAPIFDLAEFHRRTGRLEEAVAGYERGLVLMKERTIPSFEVDLLGGLGQAQHALGREHEAWLTLSRWAARLDGGDDVQPSWPRRSVDVAELYASMLRERGREEEAARMDARAEHFREWAERWGM